MLNFLFVIESGTAEVVFHYTFSFTLKPSGYTCKSGKVQWKLFPRDAFPWKSIEEIKKEHGALDVQLHNVKWDIPRHAAS